MYFTKPASNTIVRSLNDGGPVIIATDDILGAKRDADPARFTPVAKDDLIVKLPSFSGWLLLGCPGLFPGFVVLDGLRGPFLGGSHSLRLNRIVFAGLPAASVISQ